MPAPPPSTPNPQPNPRGGRGPHSFRGHPAALADDALLKQCTTRRSRASGPGGQHRNKVETAIELTHTPTHISASASERRKQADNHRIALKRLRIKLAIHFRTPLTLNDNNPTDHANHPGTPAIPGAELPGAGPSPLWQSRTKSRRIVISSDHRDFPPILAEALDTLAALNYDTTKAAAALSVTGSQLVKLFQKEPAVLAMVNTERTARNLRKLR